MTLLGRHEILTHVRANEIVRRDTFADGCLRSAAYDLRIADDELIPPEGGLYEVGRAYGETLDLQPGEIAWVSTYDRFCMPWGLAGNISPKFRFARRGLLIFTGLLVDPGFGMRKTGAAWEPKADERLCFPITNIGSGPISIRLGIRGDQLLSLQVFEVQAPPEAEREEVPGGRLGMLQQSSARPLAFFRDVREAERAMTERLAALAGRCDELDIELRSTRRSTEQLVVFGFVLFAVTIAGFSLTVLVEDGVSRDLRELLESDRLHWSGGLVALAAAAVIIAVIAGLVQCIKAYLQYRTRRATVPPAA